MKLLGLEFFKCRRRKIPLVCAAVLGAQLFWFGATLSRRSPSELAQGWQMLFYNLSAVDAILLPVAVAVIASRNGEIEHTGCTFKLLETMVPPGRLYRTKLAWGALVLAAMLVLRCVLFLLLGRVFHFPEEVPWGPAAGFTALSWAVSVMIYMLQQGLSLRFANQAAALVCGIFGGFAGLMSLLFPVFVQRCAPWGYYGLMSLVGMNWEESTHVTTFFWRTPEPLDIGLLCLWLGIFFCAGRRMFVRKEV